MSPRTLISRAIDTFRNETIYTEVHNDDKASESTETLLNSTSQPRITRSYYLLTAGNLVLFFTSVLLFALSHTRSVTDSQCTEKLYTWSPAFEAIEYHEEDYTGVFRQGSEFRGTPTPEIDERWVQLWDYREFDVPEAKWDLMNRTGDETIVRTAKGGGAALMWGMHQLHCLDWLRMWSYKDHYLERDGHLPDHFNISDNLIREHLDHCVDVLRQDMMCHMDVTPYFIVYDEEAPLGSTFDFSPHQKCRDFNKIRQWNVDNLA